MAAKKGKSYNLLIKDFDADLHKRAKIQAAVEETSLKEIVQKALREYLTKKERR